MEEARVSNCFTSALPYVEHLSLTNVSVQGSLLSLSALAPNLRSLTLVDNDMSGAISGEFMAGTPNLTEIRISNSPNFGGNLWGMRTTAVEQLLVSGSAMAESSLAIITGEMVAIQYLRLEGNPGLAYASNAFLAIADPTRIVVTGYIVNPPGDRMCEFPAAVTTSLSSPSDGQEQCSRNAAPALCARAHCAAGLEAISFLISSAVAVAAARATPSLVLAPTSLGLQALLPLNSSLWAFRVEATAVAMPPPALPPGTGVSVLSKKLADTFADEAALSASWQGLWGNDETALRTTLTTLRVAAVCAPGRMGPSCRVWCGSAWASFVETHARIYNGTSSVLMDVEAGVPQAIDTSVASQRSLRDRCLVPVGCTALNCSARLTTLFNACDSFLAPAFATGQATAALPPVAASSDCRAAAVAAQSACVFSASPPECQAPALAITAALALSSSSPAPSTVSSATLSVRLGVTPDLYVTSGAALQIVFGPKTVGAALALASASALFGMLDPTRISLTDVSASTATSVTLTFTYSIVYQAELELFRGIVNATGVPALGAVFSRLTDPLPIAGLTALRDAVFIGGSLYGGGTVPTATALPVASPSSSPLASAAPTVTAALVLSGIDLTSGATMAAAVIAKGIAASMRSVVPSAAGATIIVTSIVDVATGAVLYSGTTSATVADTKARRLATSAVRVAYSIVLPATASAATLSTLSAVTGSASGSGAATATFEASVGSSIKTEATNSGIPALVAAFLGVAVTASATAMVPAASGGTEVAPLIGGIVGALAGLAALAAAYYWTRVICRRRELQRLTTRKVDHADARVHPAPVGASAE